MISSLIWPQTQGQVRVKVTGHKPYGIFMCKECTHQLFRTPRKGDVSDRGSQQGLCKVDVCLIQ